MSGKNLLYIIKYQIVSMNTPHVLGAGTILNALRVPTVR